MKQAEHVLVAGPSGGGKTTLCKELMARHPGPAVYLSTAQGDDYPQAIAQARQTAASAADTWLVVVDEAQNAPTFRDGTDGPVRTMLHEDRKKGVKCVIASQNPQDLHTSTYRYGPLQQCQYFIWCGEGRTWHRGFREWLNLEQDQLPGEQFDYAIFRPTDPPEVVETGETDPTYG